MAADNPGSCRHLENGKLQKRTPSEVFASIYRILEERNPKGDVAADWFRQLQIELAAERSSREKKELYVKLTKERGAGSELRSSKDLIAKWQGPLADVIFEEQRLVCPASLLLLSPIY
jgi:hypothetical protein